MSSYLIVRALGIRLKSHHLEGLKRDPNQLWRALRFCFMLKAYINRNISVFVKTCRHFSGNNKMPPVEGDIEVDSSSSTSPPTKIARVDTDDGDNVVLKFAKLTPNATVPTRGSVKAAGYDLYR